MEAAIASRTASAPWPASAGPFLIRRWSPWPLVRGWCSSIRYRVVRSTSVPIAELSSPRIGSPSQWPGTARSSAGARAALGRCAGRPSARAAAHRASFETFGRLARRSACHCAVVARYAIEWLRVDALRRSSLEIVDGDRPDPDGERFHAPHLLGTKNRDLYPLSERQTAPRQRRQRELAASRHRRGTTG